MPSLPKTSTAGKAFLLCCVPLLLLLLPSSSSVRGASLREHRLRGSELDSQRETLHQTANADMLKALEYIENLHQRTGSNPQQQKPLTPGYDASQLDDTEKLRAMLKTAFPTETQGQAGHGENKEKEEEEEEEEREGNEEDKTQEWLQAVLRTLQQKEQASEPVPSLPNTAHLSLGEGGRPAPDETDGAYRWAQLQRGTRPHKRYPLMFEDDQKGEGDEGEEEAQDEEEQEDEGTASDRGSPFKRTNEDVEEKYTPQNLATLQSMFEELGRLANDKATHKRQAKDDDDDDEDNNNDDDDMFNVSDLPWEDTAGGLEDWAPQEEQEDEEEEEEERGNEHEADRGLDYGSDEEAVNDDEDEENYPVKRATNSGPQDNPDDIADLVDYYLLKVLEKTQEEEQKRELEEEKRRAERRAAQSQYRDNIDPQAIYQLIQISQKYQIPPEDLVDMLKTGQMTNQDRTASRSQAQSHKSNELARVENRFSQISSNKKHKSPEAEFYNRRLPDRQTSYIPDDITTEEILSILGLGSVRNQDSAALKRQKQHKSSQSRLHTQPGRQGEYALPKTRVPEKLKDDYDDTVGEDELAAYLAAQILAQYPDAVYKAGQKRAASDGEQAALGSFEQAVQDYFDQMDSDKSPLQKRQSETEDVGGATQTQSLDDDALMKIMSYLNPENDEESDDDNADGKTVEGM